ncbi:MAG: hypothetical protein WBG50_11910 [Desulfomonilaceae bacterium]
MGLALDEPREGDSTYEINELTVIVDPFALKVIKESGGINIRSSVFGPTAELESSAAGGCSC